MNNLPIQQLQAWGSSEFSGTNWPDFWNAEDVDWDKDNWAISNSNWRFRNDDATVNAKAYDPWNTGNTETSPGVCYDRIRLSRLCLTSFSLCCALVLQKE